MESSVSPTAAFACIPMLFAIRFGVPTLFTIFLRTVCSFAFSEKKSSSVQFFHKICMRLCMPDMLLGDGLCHNCHMLGLLGPHCSVMCLCVSEFSVELREWLQNVSPLQVHLSACSLWLFPTVHAGMLLLVWMQS